MSAIDMKNFWARLASWVVVTGLVLVAVWLASQVFVLRHENQSLQTERMLAEVSFKLGQAQLAERTLLAENMINQLGSELRQARNLTRLKISFLTAPIASSAEPHAIVVWDSTEQAGLLTLENPPANAAPQDYQLWISDPAYPAPVNCGIFHLAAAGPTVHPFKPDQAVTHATAFTLSLEPTGGATQTVVPMVFQGK